MNTAIDAILRPRLLANIVLLAVLCGYATAAPVGDSAPMPSQLSHRQVIPLDELPNTPRYRFDPQQLLLVVERDARQIHLIDGNSFTGINQLPTRELHGQPVFSAAGRFVYAGSVDGWISLFDLHIPALIAELRIGTPVRDFALSADNRYLLVAGAGTLLLLDALSLQPIKQFPAKSGNGTGSDFSAVHIAPPRNSFFVELRDIDEIWEINYADRPPPGFGSWVHDFHPESGDEVLRRFPLRRLRTQGRLADFSFDTHYEHLLGTAAAAGTQVIDLYIGRRIATLDLPGRPRSGTASTLCHRGQPLLAIADQTQALLSLVDMQAWTRRESIRLPGRVGLIATHPTLASLWLSVRNSADADSLQILDTATLKLRAIPQTQPRAKITSIAFTTDGRHVLVGHGTAVTIYSTQSADVVATVPMRNVSGIYTPGAADSHRAAAMGLCAQADR